MADRSLWNSPVVRAYLVWRMVRGYETVCATGMPILLLFPALTILASGCYCNPLRKRVFASLTEYVYYFCDSSGNDSMSLGGLTEDTEAEKGNALQALRFALAASLVRIDPAHGTLRSKYQGDNTKAQKMASAYDKEEGRFAEALSVLLARETPDRIAVLLGVRF